MQYKWQAAIIVALGLFMAILDNTIVNVALPQMLTAFKTDQSTIEWVITAYFLSQAAVIPAVGYLADRVGEKLVYLTALAIFTVGSALCALAPNETALIVFRVLQGIGGGALFPIAFAITYRIFPPEERGPASAVIGVPVLLAPVFGPTLGGLLTNAFDWRAIFTVNIPIGILVFIFGYLVLKGRSEDIKAGLEPPMARSTFDILGLVLSIAGTTGLVYGINEWGSYSFNDLHVWPFFTAGLVLLAIFVFYELRSNDPVMDLRLFRNYTFTIGNVLTWGLSAFLFGSLFLFPIFLERVQGKDALATGLILIGQGLGSVTGVILSSRLYNQLGPRPIVITGLVFVTVATFGFIHLTPDTSWQSLEGWLVLRGLGFGMTNIPLQTLTISRVDNRGMARASSLVNVTRQIFSAVGISALTAYLTAQAKGYGVGYAAAFQRGPLQEYIAQCKTQFATQPQMIQGCIQKAANAHAGSYVFQHTFTAGLNDTFVLVLIGTAVTVVLGFFAGRDPNIERMKAARARGEQVQGQALAIGE